MQLPRGSYYYKAKDKPSDEALEVRIADICLEFAGYGYRRVTKQVHREGWIVSHKKVARIMREKGWSCRSKKKKWITTTNSNHGFEIYPSLIKGVKISAVNEVWVADITYIHILCLSGGYSGRFFKKGHRVCLIKKHRYPAYPRCLAYGRIQ